MGTRDAAITLDRYRRHLSRGRAALAEMTGAVMELSSDGSQVSDADGTRYLNCGGYGVFILGHRHPRVTQAVIRQIETHPMSTRLLLEPTAGRAAEALASVTPEGLDRVHFVNSGAEATEAAIKLARANGKPNLISMAGGYHGKTMGALTLTAKEVYQRPFRPLLPDTRHVEFGNADDLETTLRATPDACVVIEPVQGEGGVILPQSGYLSKVRELCTEYGAMLVVDEIQTGLGRLGHWWGVDEEGVVPDILLVGKNLSGGVIPAAAMVATPAAYKPFDKDPFLHTSTFAASPVAMAAAEAAVHAIRDEGLIDRAAWLGERLLTEIRRIVVQNCPHLVREVRGAGLLIGVELNDEELAGELTLELMDEHVLVNHSLNANKVLRLTPPAVLRDEEMRWILTAFEAATSRLAAHHPNHNELKRSA